MSRSRIGTPPRRRLTAVAAMLLTAGAALTAVAVVPAQAAYDPEHTAMQGSPTSMGQTNGPVWALEMAAGKIFAGGEFTSTRPAGAAAGTGETGRSYLAAFDAGTGAPLASFHPVLQNDYTGGPGIIYAMALSPDQRTLYVGGNFNKVDGQRAEHLARFDTATGQFLGGVGSNGVDGTVRALALSPDGNTLYVGGGFSRANYSARHDLAAFDLRTGNLTGWAPTISNNVSNEALRVVALAVSSDASRVFVAGPFLKVNGAAAQGFMAVNATTGQNVSGWRADYLLAPYNWGTTIEVVGSTVYLGARDDVSSSTSRKEGVWSLNAGTGAVNWYEACYGDTFGLQAVGNDLYVASHAHDCADAGGMPETSPRTYLAVTAINRTTGKLKPYFVQTSGNSANQNSLLLSRALATDGNQLVMGGGFDKLNGSNQANLARFAAGSAPAERAAWPSVKTCSGCSYVDVSVLEASDRDDIDLTYKIYRGYQTTTPIATVRSESFPYVTQTFTVRDTNVPAGTYYRVLVTDPAGNAVMSVRSATIALAASDDTVEAGKGITLTAQVSGGTSGRVTFFDGGHRIGTAEVKDGTATLRVPDLRAGTRVFSATYASSRTPLKATMGRVEVRVNGR